MPEEKYIVDKNGNKRRMRRAYTDEFKQQIVNLYNTGNYTRADLIREYELTETALKNSGSFREKDNRTPEENELIRLNKELKQLRMENDILKQAALIFGRKENQH